MLWNRQRGVFGVSILVVLLGLVWVDKTIDAQQDTGGNNCAGNCSCGYESSVNYLGGIECQHGPELHEEQCDMVRAAIIAWWKDKLKTRYNIDATDDQAEAYIPEMAECCDAVSSISFLDPATNEVVLWNIPGTVKPKCPPEGDSQCVCYACVNQAQGTLPACEGIVITWKADCGEVMTSAEAGKDCDLENFGGANDIISWELMVGSPANNQACNGKTQGDGVGHKYYCGGAMKDVEYTKCVANNCPETYTSARIIQRGQRQKCKNAGCAGVDVSGLPVTNP